MKNTNPYLPSLLAVAVIASSCGSMRSVSEVRDDVYYMPSDHPAVASTTPVAYDEPAPAPPQEDYYDAKSSSQFAVNGNYYDMAYNDPYYYNYGRFGFGTGMGYQTGWNGPGWGMGFGYGAGIGWSPGWNTSIYFGYGWGNPYPYWRRPWGWPYYGGGWGNPWYDPWYGGYGYGYGPYYGPFGSCACCYSPVIIGGGSGVVVGHRPSMNGNGGGQAGGTGLPPRAGYRDPVGLTRDVKEPQRTTMPDRTFERRVRSTDPVRNTWDRPSDRPVREPASRPSREPSVQPNRERAPQRNTNIGRERTSPSRSTSPSRGGGSSGGSGGSRSGGGGRPR